MIFIARLFLASGFYFAIHFQQMFLRRFPLIFCCSFGPLLLPSVDVIFAFELALFANNGCYSHDVMLREVGDSVDAMLCDGSIRRSGGGCAATDFQCSANSSAHWPPHRIHWVQMFMYDFGFERQLRRPSHWHSVVMGSAQTDGDSRPFMERGSRLLWEMTVPLDHNRPWNLRGALFLYDLIRRNQQNCEHFVKSVEFREFLEDSHVDLVVVDHFLQCFTTAASLLNASATIQFSNWPIADGYISALNIPAPPSAYPKTSTPFSAREMRSFSVRLRNSLFHVLILLVRFLQRRMVANFFVSVKMFRRCRRGVRLEQAEAAHVFYAGRAEFITEPVRPISNRIKHFGCANCASETPKTAQHNARESGAKKSCQIENVQMIGWPNRAKNASLPSARGCTDATNSVGQRAPFEKHFLMVSPNILHQQQQFALINWHEMDSRRFVLVSFGSIAKVEFMPDALLRSFLYAFSKFPSVIFVWQTNSEPTAILAGKKWRKLPGNVRMVRWAPIKTLLAHPNLHYAILHGGVNTINEALIYGGKPILGIPLQGDQPSNLQRLVDLGMAVQVDIGQVWDGQLSAKMALIEQNFVEYGRRAQQIAAMVKTYRMGIGVGQQDFWFRWVANKPFLKHSAHKFFHNRYRSSIEYFAVSELGTALALLFSICLFLTSQQK